MSEFAAEGPFGPIDVDEFGRNVSDEAKAGWLRVVFEESDDARSLLSRVVSTDVDGDGKKEMGTERDVLREITASISVGGDDIGREGEWVANLYGVHFLETGNVVLATTSDKFAGIFALPHMTVSRYNYGLTQQLLNRTLGATIREQEDGLIHGFNPWSSLPDGQSDSSAPLPKCELVVYLQQYPVSLPASTLPLIETELRHPTGAFPPSPRDMRFSLLAFSPDCGYIIESKGPPDYVIKEANHLVGLKVEVEWMRARQHILIFSLAIFLQVLLLVRQMRDASTPSTRSRISFYTIAMLAMGDGYTTMTLCLASLFVQAVWVPLIGTAFLAFMSVSFFGMRFLLDIYTVQAPERERVERARREAAVAALAAARAATAADANVTAVASPAPPTRPIPMITAAGADTLPLPVTAPRPIDTGATPVFIPSDQDITQPDSPPPAGPNANPTNTTTTTTGGGGVGPSGFGALYTRFYLLLLILLFLSLNATSWPPAPRRAYFTLLSLTYLSLWLPQIARNVQRNCRRALRWDFVMGQSALRLVPFCYFYGYASNVAFADVDTLGLVILITWVALQVGLLGSQEVLGPRWFLPRGFDIVGNSDWVPKAYDYHPVLRDGNDGDEEGGGSGGSGGNLPMGAAEAFAVADASATSSPDVASGGGAAAAAAGRAKTRSAASSRRGSESKSRDKNKRVFDCAICMGDLEVPVFRGGGDNNNGSNTRLLGALSGLSSSSTGGATAGETSLTTGGGRALLLERRKYMVTPCRHIFHTACLEGWMKYRLQCPVCREELPPV
ncbi:hypothetical protein AAFC00_006263 [Neodothiora populina]